jgi:hypothetical protein
LIGYIITDFIGPFLKFENSNQTMSNVLKLLYDAKESYSDITIQIQSGKTILCHKTILGVQSEVFKKMFSSNMKEGSSKVIKIEEDDSKSVELMLKYMYCIEESLVLSKVLLDCCFT